LPAWIAKSIEKYKLNSLRIARLALVQSLKGEENRKERTEKRD
jgi:hypothetical protein